MARIGGRAARWVVAACAAAAAALLVAAAVALTGSDPGLASAAVDGTTSTTGADTSERGTSPRTAVPSRGSDSEAPPASSVSGTPAPTPSSSGPPSSGVASSTPPALASSAGGAEPEYPTWPGATADAPFVSFIGDSWTDGVGATDGVGYAYLTGRMLGWTHRVLGVSGSGYVLGGSTDVPFDERIAAAVEGNPDVVVIQGSINEAATPAPELTAAVEDTLTRLVRAAGPDTAVVVLGASDVPGVPVPDVGRINDILRAEAARQSLLFVDVAAEVWSDPADPSIWADPLHVNDAGAAQIAGRLAPVLQAVLAG